MEFTPTAETPLVELPASPPPPPKFDLWMVAALGFLPLEVVGFCVEPWEGRLVGAIFVAGIGFHCLVRQSKGRPFGNAAFTGAWLAPVILVVVWATHPGPRVEELLFALLWSAAWGLLSGLVVAKQLEAAFVLVSRVRRRIEHGAPPQRATAASIRERLDEEITPLEAPPMYGLPRTFGIRGLLIVTTWAALLMGILRAIGASPSVYFVVITFAAGTLAAQVLLFKGRHPIKAAMWTGAFLLPLESLAVELYWNSHVMFPRGVEMMIGEYATMCALLVPAGIALGAATGAIGGALYLWTDELLVRLFRGIPDIALEPIADADAGVLLGWIIGPNFCRRWAGDQLIRPLDRQQLLDRFAAARAEQSVRRIFKAVDARTGNMVGYVELRGFDYAPRRVAVELALVDPSTSERGRLSVRLLQATATFAFRRLEMVSIMVGTAADRPEIVECCQAALMPFYNCFELQNEIRAVAGGRRFAESL